MKCCIQYCCPYRSYKSLEVI